MHFHLIQEFRLLVANLWLVEATWSSDMNTGLYFICQRDREKEHKQGKQQAEGKTGSPLSKEPDAGINLRTLES